MSSDVADVEPLPEWASLIAGAVDPPGYKGNTLATRSNAIARMFSELDGDLETHHFSESLMSRMRNGKLNKPRREKLIVLKLTLLCLADHSYPSWSSVRREEALAEAITFAEQVLDAATSREVSRKGDSRRTNARHEHAVELLGTYGEDLIRQVEESSAGEAEAKLALLHQLGGNSDDARYWSSRAHEHVDMSSKQKVFSLVHRYAVEYQRAHEPEIAYLYWKYAAEYGDGLSAFRLGQMAELKGDPQEAAMWNRKAFDLGYSGALPGM